MKLLIDTDIFWKLAICDLLDDALQLLGSTRESCGRLPALPFMLARGRLRNKLGDVYCCGLIQIAESMPVIAPAEAKWLDLVSQIPEIDPGEALIYATAAATNGSIFLSSDKRALGVLKNIQEYVGVLSGRIVILEAILLALCDRLGVTEVTQRIQPLLCHDIMIRACFSPGNPNPPAALHSYLSDAAANLVPLVLWQP